MHCAALVPLAAPLALREILAAGCSSRIDASGDDRLDHWSYGNDRALQFLVAKASLELLATEVEHATVGEGILENSV